MVQLNGICVSVLGIITGIIFLIKSLINGDNQGIIISCFVITIGFPFLFLSLYSLKQRDLMEKNNELLEKSNELTGYIIKIINNNSSKNPIDMLEIKQNFQKYKSLYENGQITKEEYEDFLAQQHNSLKS